MTISNKNSMREEIIIIAIKHFSKFGYEKTRLLDIANEAKTSTTTVYSFLKQNMICMKLQWSMI